MRIQNLLLPVVAGGVLAVAACGSSDTSGGVAGTSSSSSSSTSSAHTYTCATGTATASGSTALQPLVQKAAEAYQAACPGATISVSGGGSSTGLSNVATGTSDIGDSDVPSSNAKGIDTSTLTDHQVAIVVFAVVVNPKTNVTALTTQQVQDLFSGKVTNWKDVGGADLPVTLIERKPGSGTRLSFDKDVMKGTAESQSPASTQDSTQLVVQQVAGNDGGVSYINVASAGTSVTPVTIDGAHPTPADVESGKYGFYSHEHMYTKGDGSAVARSFIDFILSDTFQTTQVGALGFLPVSATSSQSAADK